jgi:hypothetical protein
MIFASVASIIDFVRVCARTERGVAFDLVIFLGLPSTALTVRLRATSAIYTVLYIFTHTVAFCARRRCACRTLRRWRWGETPTCRSAYSSWTPRAQVSKSGSIQYTTRKRKRGQTGRRRLNALTLLRDYWSGVACVMCAIGVCQCHCHETEDIWCVPVSLSRDGGYIWVRCTSARGGLASAAISRDSRYGVSRTNTARWVFSVC